MKEMCYKQTTCHGSIGYQLEMIAGVRNFSARQVADRSRVFGTFNLIKFCTFSAKIGRIARIDKYDVTLNVMLFLEYLDGFILSSHRIPVFLLQFCGF
jgi:hypothetical protein